MDWGQNTYLKDPNTLTILPASPEARDEGIAWYELQLNLDAVTTYLLAFDYAGVELERLEVRHPQSDDEGPRFSSALVRHGQREVNSDCVVTMTGGDDVDIALDVGGHKVTITGTPADVDSVQRSEPIEVDLPRHWALLVDPLTALAQALTIRGVNSKSWGCEACLALGAALVIAAWYCGAGLVPSCGGALAAGAGFYQNCWGTGVCHPEEESG